MTRDKSRARQAALRQRKLESGLTQVSVWVPVGDKEKLREIAEDMCKAHEEAATPPAPQSQ